MEISQETAQRTIVNVTQMCVRQEDPSMKRKHNTNDKMRWHKMLDEYVCVDTFYAMKAKSMKSMR